MLREAIRFSYPFSAILLDIDHFKAINDQHGHTAGDAVLQEFARRCEEKLREVDAFGRIGGEEFVAFLSHSAIDQALGTAERLRRFVAAEPVVVHGTPIEVRVSIGAAELTSDTDTLDILMQRADTALYQAKESGRNQICTA